MTLAYITLKGRGRTDAFIAKAAHALMRDGLRLCGTVRAAAPAPAGHPCDMDLRILPDGPDYRISQSLGPGARGCRLDSGVIEAIASDVETRLDRTDLLIVNKFGKLEAQGRGLCPAMTQALDADIPVLVGVNAMNLDDFLEFSDGMATSLPPSLDTLRTWARQTSAKARAGLPMPS
ncbi:DUF2478 domain-containing protein [Vannielia litorea]|uniref:DUF2478 domain-containing protein n=1 Tax=Vannielia litorea TaxID=1217970 RepID=A0A1N6E0E2_9RHOB|nr:DUF2478 domain-containing protein [Vannielia litorea]SIN76505.1 Protein of unknown function [Vannielia litorea]